MSIVEKLFGRVVKEEEAQGKRDERIELREGIIYHGDVLEKIALVEEESVDLCFTSPPYNVGKQYGEESGDARSWEEYVRWSEKWIGEVYRTLKRKGFFVLNVPMSIFFPRGGIKSSVPVGAIFTEICLRLGFEYYGTVVWDKGIITSPLFNKLKYRTTTTNPPLYEGYEILLFFRKNEGKRERKEQEIKLIAPSEWINLAWGLWRITPEIRSRIFHPAPFPYELPYRVISLCTAKEDIVLDPFMGTGTTLICCVQEGRKFIGIEKERKYIDVFLSEYRAFKEKKKLLYS